MTFRSLLNRRASWTRKQQTDDDERGAGNFTDVLIASDIPCRIEDIEAWTRFEADPSGDATRVKVLMYMEFPQDILGKDLVTIDGSDIYHVIEPDNAAGQDHHLEVRLDTVRNL